MMHFKKIAQMKHGPSVYKHVTEPDWYRVDCKGHGHTTMRGWPFASVLNLATQLKEGINGHRNETE